MLIHCLNVHVDSFSHCKHKRCSKNKEVNVNGRLYSGFIVYQYVIFLLFCHNSVHKGGSINSIPFYKLSLL